MLNQNSFVSVMQNVMRMGNSPQMITQSLISSNPQFQSIMNQIKSSVLTPQQFVESYCKQQNIDFNQVRQMANNLGIKI